MIYYDSQFEMKQITDTGIFRGYASVFNYIDCQADKVLPGAFKESLKAMRSPKDFPKMLWQHDPACPIGRWDKIEEREQGLYVEGRLFLELPKARDIYILLKEGIIDALSIGYKIKRAARGEGCRLLEDLSLFEISLVTFPANGAARILDVKREDAPNLLLNQINRVRDHLRKFEQDHCDS